MERSLRSAIRVLPSSPGFRPSACIRATNIVVNIVEPRLLKVRITEDEIIGYLADGRTISVPLVWSWRLTEATPEQRQNFEILEDGQGIH